MTVPVVGVITRKPPWRYMPEISATRFSVSGSLRPKIGNDCEHFAPDPDDPDPLSEIEKNGSGFSFYIDIFFLHLIFNH